MTTPTMRVNDNRVDVRFDVTIRARENGAERTLHEIHRMRYLSAFSTEEPTFEDIYLRYIRERQ